MWWAQNIQLTTNQNLGHNLRHNEQGSSPRNMKVTHSSVEASQQSHWVTHSTGLDFRHIGNKAGNWQLVMG